MSKEEYLLLDLVRMGVAPDTNEENLLSMDWNSTKSWSAIGSEAWRQGVSAILLDGIEKLPTEKRPPKPLLLQWIGREASMERMYARHREQIAALAEFYKEHDIRMLLLKGYGCSLCYPRPEHRPTGDADIYLFGKQHEADALIEKEFDIKVHREYHKHSTFCYNGVEVENHAKFIDDVSHKSNIRFEKVLMSVLKEEECLQSPIDNVLLPSPTFNALFLLRHTGEHFAANEIMLRHVLDVGTFFKRYHSQIDWTFVLGVYQSERMLDFFNGIATICVEYLGIEAECFMSDDKQYSYKHDKALAERILADIFRKKEILPMSTADINTLGKKLNYAIGKTCRWWHNRWKYQLVYNENLVESFWWLARNRAK